MKAKAKSPETWATAMTLLVTVSCCRAGFGQQRAVEGPYAPHARLTSVAPTDVAVDRRDSGASGSSNAVAW